MKGKQVLHSSQSDEWYTPQDTYDELNKEFGFTLDVCATDENTKCNRYYTKEDDSLVQDWSSEICWMNPPYSKVKEFIEKAATERCTTVALVPSRTDTRWFHQYCYQKENVEIRFIKGRLRFGGSVNAAPFPSMIVIFRNK